MKKYVLIQVRSSSKRLPFKALLKINKTPIINLLVKRVISKFYDTIVLTSEDASDNYLCEQLKKSNIKFYRGNLFDVKMRFLKFTQKFKDDDIIVRLTADNLFVDKHLIKQVIDQLQERNKDYLYTNPKISGVPEGISVEAFKLKTLRNFKKNSKIDKEHVTINFDRIEKNTFIFKEIEKKWKNLNTTLDTLNDFQKLKKVFKNVKNPSQIKWQLLCDTLKKKNTYTKFKKNTFLLKSILTKNLAKNLINKIISLKSQEWKFDKKSQLEFFKKNYSRLDIHNFLFLNKKLIGYTVLKKSYFKNTNFKKFKMKTNCLVFDSFIIDKSLQKKNLSEILMCYNKCVIYSKNLPTFLICNKKLLNFYKKNDWTHIEDSRMELPIKFKNLSTFSLNFEKKTFLNSKKNKISPKF